jgi:hypothetical protein
MTGAARDTAIKEMRDLRICVPAQLFFGKADCRGIHSIRIARPKLVLLQFVQTSCRGRLNALACAGLGIHCGTLCVPQ